MKTITIEAFDRKGNRLKEGDIIKSDFGVTTVVNFDVTQRQFLAFDMAPFPCSIREDQIRKHVDVIGNVKDQPDFKPVYEADIYYAKRQVELKIKKGFLSRFVATLFR